MALKEGGDQQGVRGTHVTKGKLTFCDVLSTSLCFSKGLIDFLRGLECPRNVCQLFIWESQCALSFCSSRLLLAHMNPQLSTNGLFTTRQECSLPPVSSLVLNPAVTPVFSVTSALDSSLSDLAAPATQEFI